MPPINRSQQPVAEVLRQRTGINNPRVCEECGGTFFIPVEVTEMAQGGYGSVQFRPITPAAFKMALCLCGNFISPSGLSKGQVNDERLMESVTRVRARRAKWNPDRLLQEMAPSLDNLGVLRKEVESMRAELASLLERLPEKPEQEQEPEDAVAVLEGGEVTSGPAAIEVRPAPVAPTPAKGKKKAER